MKTASWEPWHEPGMVRRDCEPHRGGFLCFWAEASAMIALVSSCVVVLAFVGLPVGAAVWFSARRDLKLMDAGVMDPAGEKPTRMALDYAFMGTVFNLLALIVWVLFVAVIVFSFVRMD
jgi:hypothetical protein